MKRSRITVREVDITSLDVDAIVNAANDRLWMGAGVAGAIKRVGGDIIESQAIALGPIVVGDAIFTTGGRLRARNVIHAAVMGQDLKTSAGAITTATRSSLRVAEGIGAMSIGFPAFGTGIGAFPIAECAALMVAEVLRHEPESLTSLVFAVFGREARLAFEGALR